jgi:hypothetical protein
METAGILEALESRGLSKLPFLALRAVSDLATEDLDVDFDQIHTLSGRVKPLGFLRYFLGHPAAALALVRLVKHSRLAAAQLAATLRDVLNEPTIP